MRYSQAFPTFLQTTSYTLGFESVAFDSASVRPTRATQFVLSHVLNHVFAWSRSANHYSHIPVHDSVLSLARKKRPRVGSCINVQAIILFVHLHSRKRGHSRALHLIPPHSPDPKIDFILRQVNCDRVDHPDRYLMRPERRIRWPP